MCKLILHPKLIPTSSLSVLQYLIGYFYYRFCSKELPKQRTTEPKLQHQQHQHQKKKKATELQQLQLQLQLQQQQQH